MGSILSADLIHLLGIALRKRLSIPVRAALGAYGVDYIPSHGRSFTTFTMDGNYSNPTTDPEFVALPPSQSHLDVYEEDKRPNHQEVCPPPLGAVKGYSIIYQDVWAHFCRGRSDVIKVCTRNSRQWNAIDVRKI